ncbi:MAG: glycoside hydrolase family 3 C-terminal domain-containing protein [Pontiellaceae bacterium]|nr:glycoside hydrolase family 3 C-terminal domain-containing protein [Pontiellaceae bacterium]MBN2785856.1 glycoside hydrolase family 3 C-terminal domain-containing protein [Pontiellaceae bacterium]
MKHTVLGLIAVLSGTMLAAGDIEKQIDEILSGMTLEEKVSLCHGATDFTTASVDRLGVPSLRFSDGPHGVRQDGSDHTYFPTGISLGSTWNPALVQRMGQALGSETKHAGIDVILGPAICINRNPLCGRFFEYMSEDPYLTGRLAVGYIHGVQSEGVAACAKHYVANSQEIERSSISEVVDERTLHEIYFPAFKASVEEGNVMTVMCAYNKVNDIYCAANHYLLTDMMKDRWGFDGVIMSDWGAVHSTVPTALAGLDLEMPGNDSNFLGKPLLEAVQRGDVPERVIDDKVRRMLRLALRLSEKPQTAFDKEANEDAALAVARESIVLLKNEGGLLPLSKTKHKRIFVTGVNAEAKHGGAGGSSAVYGRYEITPLQGLKDACGDDVEVVFKKTAVKEYFEIIPKENLWTGDDCKTHGLKASFYANPELSGEPVVTRTDEQVNFSWGGRSPMNGFQSDHFSVKWEGYLQADETGEYVLAVSSDDGTRLFLDDVEVVDNWYDHGEKIGKTRVMLEKGALHKVRVEFFEGAGDAVCRFLWAPAVDGQRLLEENARIASECDAVVVFAGIDHDYDSEGNDKPDMKLTDNQDWEISALAAANPNTVVVLVNGSPLEIGSFVNEVPAILEAWYAGVRSGRAIADILFGEVNPSGKLPVTLPKKLEDTPAIAIGEYPGQNGRVEHKEGIFVGYRYYDSKKIEPEFPFGHGLSYTDFTYEKIRVTSTSPFTASVKVTVRNAGSRPGSEVVQLYVHDEASSLERPEKELKGFRKVYLLPGETTEVSFDLDPSSFSFYNPATHQWVAEEGEFSLLVGSSSKDIRQTSTLKFGVEK